MPNQQTLIERQSCWRGQFIINCCNRPLFFWKENPLVDSMSMFLALYLCRRPFQDFFGIKWVIQYSLWATLLISVRPFSGHINGVWLYCLFLTSNTLKKTTFVNLFHALTIDNCMQLTSYQSPRKKEHLELLKFNQTNSPHCYWFHHLRNTKGSAIIPLNITLWPMVSPCRITRSKNLWIEVRWLKILETKHKTKSRWKR